MSGDPMSGGPMEAARSPVKQWRWWSLAVVGVLVATAATALAAYLTSPRAGSHLDPSATSADGAQALISLLRDRGVDVQIAQDSADVQAQARADTLLVVVQTPYLTDSDVLRRINSAPGDRLLVEPRTAMLAELAPQIRRVNDDTVDSELHPDLEQPQCDLREATSAGEVQITYSKVYRPVYDTPLTSCYRGVLVRYRADGRTTTVVSDHGFMSNALLTKQGNAALAMNLAGARQRVIWYAPQHYEGASTGTTIFDLIPNQVTWIFWQLFLVVVLMAVARGRRIGPLVAEKLPVVVRASETVEGLGRLYRSRRARDRAADALRAATVARVMPRLGVDTSASQGAVVDAVHRRIGVPAEIVGRTLFGAHPGSDTALVDLAHALDDIERKVAQT